MTLAAFEAMVRQMTAEVPARFFDGVTEVVVSPRTLPHPVRGDIYTLGECIPLHLGDDTPDTVQSRVVLYYGSFLALAHRDPTFDWQEEAWETLTHELRHHVEWRARDEALEQLDRAAEQNFARHNGEPFDPVFHLDGDSPAEGVYQVEDDWFLDVVVARPPTRHEITWHGRRYTVAVPAGTTLPAYLLVDGVQDPPPGDLILVLRRRPQFIDLFRNDPTYHGRVTVRSVEESSR